MPRSVNPLLQSTPAAGISHTLPQVSTQRPRRPSDLSKVTQTESVAVDSSQTCAVPLGVIPIQQMRKLRPIEVW